MSWVFRGLRASIQGAALKTRQLLKKLDQNFSICNSPFVLQSTIRGGKLHHVPWDNPTIRGEIPKNAVIDGTAVLWYPYTNDRARRTYDEVNLWI